ncbi:MAG: hypothetical protein SCALA702_33950 [Melioribacteraceae bacterium]|nr:MAG: hypothetical protein SCALA702_33950 [Melioribacteraceae bacterium]
MAITSGLIRDISIDNGDGFENSVYFSFDIDWVSDEVLQHFIELVESANIFATVFVTHETELLEKMRNSEKFDLGIHPNFNFLLNGDFRYGKNFREVIDYYHKMVPEATVFRSHSLFQSSHVLDYVAEIGFTHECNLYIPVSSGINLKPYYHWSGNMLRVPHYWEDDLNIVYQHNYTANELVNRYGLKIFDFHPIHLFLNTSDFLVYENAKTSLNDFELLKTKVNTEKTGVRDIFNSLLNAIK